MSGKSRPELKSSWDLIAISLLSFWLALFIYLTPENTLRIVIGIPFLLFFPGYTLNAIFFTGRRSLKLIERMAISIAFSVVLVPLIGLCLNYTSFGVRLDPILISLVLFNIVGSVLGIWRRAKTDDPFLPFEPKATYESAQKAFGTYTKTNKILTVALVAVILLSVIMLSVVMFIPRDGERFTEFYILDSKGNVTDYPNNLTVNQTGQVIIGIANHQHRTVTYVVEIWLSNATYTNVSTTYNHLYYYGSINVTLNSVHYDSGVNWQAQWQQFYNFSVPIVGQYKIWFLLQMDGQPYQGEKNVDLVSTEALTRFTTIVNDKSRYTLNLDLKVTA